MNILNVDHDQWNANFADAKLRW